MDPKLLQYYNRELQHLREVGGEFAQEFPKIAGRLGLDSFECVDPYVERLLEGFAFLAARVQLKLDAEFPRLSQHLLQVVYPNYLAPTPSVTITRFQPDPTEGSLAAGFLIPRGSVLRSQIPKGEQTACEYRTAHDVTLWPLNVVEAEYFNREAVSVKLSPNPRVKAGIRIRLQTTAGLNFNEVALDRLNLFLHGTGEHPVRLYEQIMSDALAVLIRPAGHDPEWQHVLDADTIRRIGFDDQHALLPYGDRAFHGYRLLEEYFTLPQRFLFVELTQLALAVSQCTGNELEIIILLGRHESHLDNQINADTFKLFCTPCVNLFPKRTDRIHISSRKAEYQVIADRTRPIDFEVHSVLSATGYASGLDHEQTFRPLYGTHVAVDGSQVGYFTIERRERKLPAKYRRQTPRSSYVGSEVYLSLVDRQDRPVTNDLRELGLETLCTNRDLPLYMPVGVGSTDFTIRDNAPVQSIHCLLSPTRPRPSRATVGGDFTWRLISHLSLNYLSLLDNDYVQGAAALRSLLQIYGELSEPATRKQIEGVRSARALPVTRPVQTHGPLSFGRGLEITLELDEAAFEGTGCFLLGAVLDEFFARYVSINSFTETVVRSVDRGEIVRWPARIGRRQII